MKSNEYREFRQNIGDSVHSLNTSSVALSLLPLDTKSPPKGLEISWGPKDINNSIRLSRNYIERSAYIYAVESFYEYLQSLSENPFWLAKDINFKGEEKKAQKVYNFLKSIKTIPEEEIILSELACHWRNKIVHRRSSACISKSKEKVLILKQNEIQSNFSNLDVILALENFRKHRITLKDVSTLITILLRSAKEINRFYYEKMDECNDVSIIIEQLAIIPEFTKLISQEKSEKKRRQISKWISINFELKDELLLKIKGILLDD